MSDLTLYNTAKVDEPIWPDQKEQLTLESSALHVFTDFKDTKPLVIEADVSITELVLLMRKSHVRMKVVVDSDNKFMGIITLDDVQERYIVQKVSEGYTRQELLVSDFMQKKQNLKACEYHDIAKATIQDVLETLQHNKQQHCLVIDREAHKIRGVISATDIARMLHIDVDITVALSFQRLHYLYR